MTVKRYLFSFPERFIRSVLGLGAGVAREIGEVALPDGVRHSQLYQNLVDATLRFVIEQVGGVEPLEQSDDALPENAVGPRCAVLTSEQVGGLYRDPVVRTLRSAGLDPVVIEIPDG